MDTGHVLVLVALVSLAPGALVLLVAMLRGYTIHLTMTRPHRRRDDR